MLVFQGFVDNNKLAFEWLSNLSVDAAEVHRTLVQRKETQREGVGTFDVNVPHKFLPLAGVDGAKGTVKTFPR